jgi:undecaprenyl-diphosphatase
MSAANIAATVATLVRPRRSGAPRPRRPSPSMVAVVTLVAIAAIAGAMMWLDGRAIAGVGQLPAWVVWAFDELTDFGKSGWFLWPTGVLLAVIAIGGLRKLPKTARLVLTAWAVRLSFLFAAIALPGLVAAVVKCVIGRARPLVASDIDVLVFKPFVWRVEYSSFPSGHGTTAFAAAIAIGALWPWTRPWMWTYAAVIALSRIIVTAHYPSDVIASAAFGIVGALLVRNWFAARRLGFWVDSNGTVQALPGPSFRRTKAVARRLLSA